MNKFLLTTTMATAIIFSSFVANAETAKSDTVQATANTENQVKEHHAPKFDGQKGPHENMRGPQNPGRIEDALNLTDEQKAKAKELREQSRKDIEPLMAEMKAIREKMDALRKADMQKFEALLTDEQKAKFAEFKKHEEARRPHNFPPEPKEHKDAPKDAPADAK